MGPRTARLKIVTTCSKPTTIQHCQLTDLASTERNAISSPLLRLPAELRGQIFALALNHGYISMTFPYRSPRWKIKGGAESGVSPQVWR